MTPSRPGRTRVSVCIPVYQGERHLARTLDSVLAQDYPDLEILVQDNASTDQTAEILAAVDDPRVRVRRTESVLPMSENWNTMIQHATGDLVKVVCADDLVHPQIVARQAAALAQDPGLALVSSRRHMIAEDGSIVLASVGLRGLAGRHDGRATVRRVVRRGGNPIGEAACTMFRRDQFTAAGGFDGSLMFPMDIDLWVRLLRQGDFLGMTETLAAFRLGASSLSSSLTSEQYADQQVMTDRISADPYWRLGRSTRTIARMGNFWARARHRALFVASAWHERRGGRSQDPSAGGDWLA